MKVVIENNDNQITALLSGEIDHHTASVIRETVDDNVIRARPQKLILDFSGVTFTDSSGIAVVLGRYKLLKSINGSLECRGMNTQVKKLFDLSGINRFII